jgi:hypothetical protein
MAEYAATCLSFTPVVGAWADVLAKVVGYLQAEHEPHQPPFADQRLCLVNPVEHRVDNAMPVALTAQLGPEPDGVQYWRMLTMEPWFADNPAYVKIRVRQADPATSWVELWFTSKVHDAVFAFDDSGEAVDPAAKSDLVRMMIGVAKAIGAAGFAFRLGKDNSLFGPPPMDVLRDFVEAPFRNRYGDAHSFVFAGLAAAEVDGEKFAYDTDQPTVKYRQDGYYVYDMLWPRGSWDTLVEDDGGEDE